MRPITLFSPLGEIGGAATHVAHLIRLWRSRGLPVRLIAPALPDAGRAAALANLGCPWQAWDGDDLDVIDGLAGSIVVGFCDRRFLRAAERLRALQCRLVWVSCMTWIFPEETLPYSRGLRFDAHVFQSPFQRATLERELVPYGYRTEQGHLIPGPFDCREWPLAPRPHDPAGEFVVGRLARPDPGKWSRRTWRIYGGIDHPRRRAIVMGVDDTIRKWIGPAPPWAEVLPPGAIPARDFYRRIHCLMPINFSLLENWPRIGLEAMASGVPIVAPRQGGWCDMITHGVNGFLASTAEEFAELGTLLARDEPLRMKIAAHARRQLESELANPDHIWAGWRRLLAGLDG